MGDRGRRRGAAGSPLRPHHRSGGAARARQGHGPAGVAFASIATLFFAWGFITVSVDPLIAALKAIFSLSYAEVMLTQFAFFMAYGVVSLPAAALIRRIGYTSAIVVALAIMIAGCLIVPLATHFETFAIVLVALFVIAAGITILQVAANPLAAALGPPAALAFSPDPGAGVQFPGNRDRAVPGLLAVARRRHLCCQRGGSGHGCDSGPSRCATSTLPS